MMLLSSRFFAFHPRTGRPSTRYLPTAGRAPPFPADGQALLPDRPGYVHPPFSSLSAGRSIISPASADTAFSVPAAGQEAGKGNFL